MKRVRRGFTLIEVSLFLVITTAVFVGIAVGTQSSIFQQRYNDAVQNYVEFFRSVYSQVTNVQSENTGRSDKAIYGKLVTFNVDGDNNNVINSYNVIGDVDAISCNDNSVLGRLACLGADVVIIDKDGVYQPVGFVEDYKPRWASQIQTTDGWVDDVGYKPFTGALLIVRSPSTGAVNTYFTTELINVAGYIESRNNGFEVSNPLLGAIEGKKFSKQDVDFCVNPNGAEKSNLRRDVRIKDGARNASGVEAVTESQEWEGAPGEEKNIGNRCGS